MTNSRPPSHEQVQRKPRTVGLRTRLLWVGCALGLAALALVARAVDLQFVNKDFYEQQGDQRFLREVPIATTRGMITDRNGEPLAISTPVESIWANPDELAAHADKYPQLATALGIPLADLKDNIGKHADKEFLYLRRHMDPDSAEGVVALGIPGVYSQREYKRYYPLGEVMAHVLGYTNVDDHGQEGVELAFDDWLTGKPGTKKVIRDLHGHFVENVDLVRPAVPGRDLAISIDRRLQYLSYKELAEAIKKNNADAGTAVIMDVHTGEILAMVNLPSYNPNARTDNRPSAHRNRAATDVTEPGSVMKAFTIASALETGIVTPNTTFDTNPGSTELAGHIIHDTHNHGVLTVTGIITKSSNVGAAKLSLLMNGTQMYDMLTRFGFGHPTGSGFPGESGGVLPNGRSWSMIQKATIAYGYGVSVTAMQLARAYAAIGNGGRLVTPTFVKGGQSPSKAVLDPHIASQIMAMLETVVTPEGTAPQAAVLGYRVAGKTGTARYAGAGGYSKIYDSLFIGLVPASQPRMVMVTMIHNPKGSVYYGGLVAAPVFGKVMDGALRLMDVPPDNVQQWYAAQPAAPAAPAQQLEGDLPPGDDIPVVTAPSVITPVDPAAKSDKTGAKAR
ncbi:MAG TPA: penicillin-binding transpeptidase domain-containing protein [Xanthomonadaceae bacterium]|jgi:cell division protein FtsI (penicillin-binding protein 3)|nr:penicillin-binding transpeptidase domain-containing protein [Xanthomonadaceae bacterium]